MKNLIIIAHPNKNSFCYNGIMKTIRETLKKNKEDIYVLDLYGENITLEFRKEKIKEYKERKRYFTGGFSKGSWHNNKCCGVVRNRC